MPSATSAPASWFLDTAADLFGGNENIRTQVRQFISNACGRIAREIDGAVLLCAHPSLSGMASGSGSSGSTAWNNTVRSRLYLTQAEAQDEEQTDPDLRVLTRKKSNYARAGETLVLRWTDGMMMPVAQKNDDGTLTTHAAIEMLKHIDERWAQKNPFSASPQSDRYVVPVMVQRLGLSHGAAKSLLGDWIANEMVTCSQSSTASPAQASPASAARPQSIGSAGTRFHFEQQGNQMNRQRKHFAQPARPGARSSRKAGRRRPAPPRTKPSPP